MKPLLACSKPLTPGALTYPVVASQKIDGIRCLTFEGGAAKTRTLKPQPNAHVRKCLAELGVAGLDGELIVAAGYDGTFSENTAGLMAEAGKPDFEYHVFDKWDAEGGFLNRMLAAAEALKDAPDWVKIVEPQLMETEAELLAYEIECLDAGYEGVMVRSPLGRYKHGRSTMNEGILLKLKRFLDSEAVIIGYKEAVTNENVAYQDELGHTKRGTSASGMKGTGTLGSLNVRDLTTGVEFWTSGWDVALGDELWSVRDSLTGLIVKYKFQPTGVKDKPRFPTFLGLRHPDDMGDPA